MSGAIIVNADNFVRAETDMYFSLFARRGFGKFHHFRDLPLDDAVRPNRDTLYSEGVFDLDAGPVSITLPSAGRRFMSLMVVDEDHFVVAVTYGSGKRTYQKGQIGTRYLFAAVRILVNPNDPEDVKDVHALQDGIRVSQARPGAFEPPNWDKASQTRIRNALLMLGESLPNLNYAFGDRDNTDPIRHLIGTASAWGGNPERDAVCLDFAPPQNDGRRAYRLNVEDVPVDAFWSVTVYDETGRLRKNPLNAYSVNSIAAEKGVDGSVTVQFGDCPGKTINCLPVFPGWNYMVRLYRPRSEVLTGRWTFPEAQPVQ